MANSDKCTKCGGDMQANWNLCPQCGQAKVVLPKPLVREPIQSYPISQIEPYSAPTELTRDNQVVGVVLVVIGAIAAIGGIAYGLQMEEMDKNSVILIGGGLAAILFALAVTLGMNSIWTANKGRESLRQSKLARSQEYAAAARGDTAAAQRFRAEANQLGQQATIQAVSAAGQGTVSGVLMAVAGGIMVVILTIILAAVIVLVLILYLIWSCLDAMSNANKRQPNRPPPNKKAVSILLSENGVPKPQLVPETVSPTNHRFEPVQ